MMSSSRLSLFALAALPAIVLASLTGCSAPQADTVIPASSICLTAAEKAVQAQEVLYDTHPLWDMDMPGLDAPLEEQEKFDALTADEEAQWQTIVQPLYDSCEGPEELFAALKEFPAIAGFTRADAVAPYTIEAWCWDDVKAALPACAGWEEWVAANPE